MTRSMDKTTPGRKAASRLARSLATLPLLLSISCGANLASPITRAMAQPNPSATAESLTAGHPAEDYRRAADAFRAGRRDEATYLFYQGQFRYRVHLKARPGLQPDGDPALFASLNEALGRPINEWAFGDVPSLAATIDRVLAWQAANEDPFTPKASFAAAHAEVRSGLASLKAQVMAERDTIKAQRRANGLPNRS